eukprot:gnl/TRDRNA2_/TRDRNA2_144530_c1_seq1.p1 gnl/TRDRNA2_/TRDRNA2_144530_c1~~gnl/TRDRNA2_/TRDRNA2_144530_c1_seq1.p1  ORF type:complete len:380 (+),score=54.02 gnl/TRDRNA2_/TRDRNA2_144530_c1_seq1:576-1715(+)
MKSRLQKKESTLERCRLLSGHRPRDAAMADTLAKCVDGEAGVGSLRHWEAFVAMPLSYDEAEKLLASQVQEQIESLLSFCAAVASEKYFVRVRQALLEDQPEQRTCCQCLDEGIDLSRLAITPCAHSFCTDCLRTHVDAAQSCSSCSQPLKMCDVRPLVANQAGVADTSQWAGAATVTPLAALPNDRWAARFNSFGTKLSVLVQKLLEMHDQDSTAKAIVFVQFDDLKYQVAAALREGGVAAAQLKGSVSQRATIIRDWQENPDSRTFVLLLSLAESASGTNLTSASHIVFVHPMLASTEDRAAAQELQAIGRARRHGQLRDTLHVWRFVAADTLEEPITQRHQRALVDHEETLKARATSMAEESQKGTATSRGRRRGR